MGEWNINTVSKDEFLDEMLMLIRQIDKNSNKPEELFKIAKALAGMVGEIRGKSR